MASQHHDDSDTDWDSAFDEEPEESSYTAHARRLRRASSAKAREAREASNENARTRNETRRQNPPPPRRPRDSIRAAYDEVSPLLGSEPPPPAYADATAGRPYTGLLASSAADGDANTDTPPAHPESTPGALIQGYGSISTPHTDSQPERQPQSIGASARPVAPEDVESGRGGLSPRRKRKRSEHRIRRILRRGALLLVLIAIIVLLASSTFNDTHDDDNDAGDGRKPSPLIPPNATFPDSQHSINCPFEYYSDSLFYEFEAPRNFLFVELLEEETHLSGGIGGLVRIAAPLEGQTAAIVVGVGIATTAPWYVSQINVKQEVESLYMKAPTLLKKNGRSRDKPCMGVFVTIFVRPDVRLHNFEIATENLNLLVEPGLFENTSQDAESGPVYISNTTDFTVVNGDVSVAYWSSRETRIDVISGSVKGTYDLYDLLSVRTRSGSVNIGVRPQAVDKTAPAPADFTASSNSGSIDVQFPTTAFDGKIPERDYRTRVETGSGSISGSYIHGSTSSFRTNSGSIRLKALPYSADTWVSTMKTQTGSGHTQVEVLPSFTQPGIPIRRMRSVHTALSAGVYVTYPQQWEGTIEGETKSGSMSVRGRDVVPTKSYTGPAGKHIVARKGSGDGRLALSTKSGSMDALIGDLY